MNGVLTCLFVDSQAAQASNSPGIAADGLGAQGFFVAVVAGLNVSCRVYHLCVCQSDAAHWAAQAVGAGDRCLVGQAGAGAVLAGGAVGARASLRARVLARRAAMEEGWAIGRQGWAIRCDRPCTALVAAASRLHRLPCRPPHIAHPAIQPASPGPALQVGSVASSTIGASRAVQALGGRLVPVGAGGCKDRVCHTRSAGVMTLPR